MVECASKRDPSTYSCAVKHLIVSARPSPFPHAPIPYRQRAGPPAAAARAARTAPAVARLLVSRSGRARTPRLGARQAAEQGGELLDLVRREVLKEQAADAGHVGAAGLAELLGAPVGQLRVGDPGIVGAGDAPDTPR